MPVLNVACNSYSLRDITVCFREVNTSVGCVTAIDEEKYFTLYQYFKIEVEQEVQTTLWKTFFLTYHLLFSELR